MATGLRHATQATGVNDPAKQISKDAWNQDIEVYDASLARTAFGVGSGDSPTFSSVEIGNADTTVARVSAGDISVEGNLIYRAGGTDVPVTDGGTGASTASGARTNLGLGTISTQDASNVSITGGTISSLTKLGVGAVATEIAEFVGAGTQRLFVTNSTGPVTMAVKAAASFGTFGSVTNHGMIIQSNNADRINVTAAGRVLLGATPPTDDTTSALQVAGTIATKSATGAGMNIKTATTLLSAVSGATVTATNLIPATAFLLGVSTRITTALGTGGGTTGYQVGDGTDADRFGVAAAVTSGTTTKNTDATADPTGWALAARSVVITAVGGNFNGTGAIRVSADYIDNTAPTS